MSEFRAEHLIFPGWPAPARIRAVSTTRHGGVSASPYDSLNLADHVGDEPARVAENRRWLAAVAGYPAEPAWLQQVHGNRAVAAETVREPVAADAAWTR
ncbi:MAG TPA: laccase domain-containing protein, partial [Candidatus Competibacter sp.]|nr:laccase domain-containing protein [Candidatus Competibacter sp.]